MKLINTPTLVWSLGALFCASACTIKIEDTAGGSASASSGPESTGEASTSATSTGEATTGGSDTVTSGASEGMTSTTNATSATSSTSGAETSTGGDTETGGDVCACGEGEFCAWELHTCGADPSDVGACMPRPDACDAVFQPVCGCDLMVHGNLCEAQAAGVDVAIDGGCEAPEGYFPCGPIFCDIAGSYCAHELSDVGGIPDSFQCAPLPDNCQQGDCSCLAEVPCGLSCEVIEGGGFEVACGGG